MWILSGSLQFDPQAQMRWKDGNSSYDVQLSVRRWLPPFGRNLRRKNSSSTPTSENHNFLVQTLIRENFTSLESRHRELSNDMLHDPFWAPENSTRAKIEEDSEGGCVADKIAMWRAV